MQQASRTLAAAVAVAIAVIAAALAAVAQTSPQSAQRGIGGPRSVPAATAPPLPFGDQSRISQGAGRSTLVPGSADALTLLQRLSPSQRTRSSVKPYFGPRPPIPKLTDLLKHKFRSIRSANGASIVLTGTTNTPFLEDQTLAYGSEVYWLCQNLQPNTSYRYVVFAPDGYGYIVQVKNYLGAASPAYPKVSTFTTDAQGRCAQSSGGTFYPYYAELALQTPVAQVGAGTINDTDPVTPLPGPTRAAGATDPAYSGVWTIAVQNVATSQFEAVTYSVVLGTLNFTTYSNAAMTTPANDFASGSNVYVKASGLNPNHFYAYGFVNVAGSGMPCLGVIPSNAQSYNNATCFSAGGSGILPAGGLFSGSWTSPSSGTNSAGTVAVQLFDATTNDLISTQQISLNPSSIVWNSLVPYNGATNGTNVGDTFATDGISGGVVDQSVTGVTFSGTGVVSGHVYKLTLSNANGVVMSSTTTDTGAQQFFGKPQFFSAVPTFTAASNSFNQQLAFPINAAALTAWGATQIPFAPNVYTAQLYDVTAAQTVGSKSFQILSYSGSFQWTNPAGGYVTVNAGAAQQSVTATLTNDAGANFGAANGDAIVAIGIANDVGGNITLGIQSATTTDSLGQVWNLVNQGGTSIAITPAVAGQSLPAGATIPLPITVNPASGTCKTGCLLRTSITPLHGINPSTMNATMTGTPTNGLSIVTNGGGGTMPSYSWSVGAYSGAQLGTPRFSQMMYRSGTNGATGGTYTVTLTVNNTGAPSSATMSSLELVMPPSVNPSQLTPSLTSVLVNGVNKTASWTVYTQNGGNGATADATLPASGFAFATATGTAMIPNGQTAVFTFKLPILPAAFAFQQIAALGNYKATSYNVGPTTTVTSPLGIATNIDSTELAVYSLDPSLMTATLSPASIPAQANVSTTFKLVNTSTGQDPNPDYINQLLISVPSAGGVYPTSVTVASPSQPGVTWTANATGTAGQWLIDLCTVNTIGTWCSTTADANSLPPGAELDVTLKYTTAPVAGQYPIAWSVTGAVGGGRVTATTAQQPVLTISNTTATTSFTYAGGYTATPAYPPVSPIQPVLANTQPTVGSWSNYTNGNGFVYELKNNGTTPITDVSITLPALSTAGSETDATDWTVVGSTIYTYGSGAAGAQCGGNGYKSLTQPIGPAGTGGPKAGSIVLSGCSIAVGGTLDVFFDALSPYDVASIFRFDASVANGGTPPASVNTVPLYQNSNTIKIVADAQLAIAIPGGTGQITGLSGSSSPTTVCPSCTYTPGTTPLINLNGITGTLTAKDVLAASVYSNDIGGWNLSVSADQNPGTQYGQVSTWVDSAASSSPTTGSFSAAVSSSPGTVIPTTGTPLLLSSWTGGSYYHKPIDNIMSYLVTLNALSVSGNTSTTVTLTYTLIAN